MRPKLSIQINKKAVKFYLDNIRYFRHFEVNLGLNPLGNNRLDNASCDGILDTLVAPLLDVSTEAYIYHNSRTIVRPVPKPPIPKWIAKDPTRLTIDISKTPIDECRPFWRWALMGLDGAKGTLVLQIPKSAFPQILVGQNSFNPHILTNLRTAASAVAISFCKRAAKSGDTVGCMFSRDAYHCTMSFFGDYRFLSYLYRHCVKHCRFTMIGLEMELRGSKMKRCKKTC